MRVAPSVGAVPPDRSGGPDKVNKGDHYRTQGFVNSVITDR